MIFLHNCGCFGRVKVSVVINLGMTPSSPDLHLDGRSWVTTLLQLWIQKIKSMIKLTWFHPGSKVNITGRKLIERGTWDLRSSSWWKETFNMAFFQIHGQQWETLNKTSLLVNILYCIDNVWDCNSWMGGSETGVVGQRREDSGRPGTTCVLISEVKAVLDFQLSDVCDNAK